MGGLPRRCAPRSDGRVGLGWKGRGLASGVVAVHIALLCHGEERSDVAIHSGPGRVSFAKGGDGCGGVEG
jgi:hypothetical protein